MLQGQAAGPAVKAVEPYERGPMAGQVYKLGFGNGSLIDNGDGTASYRNITPEFRVTIADITGFSYTRVGDTQHLALKILGHGTELASVYVGKALAYKIETWFRTHPDFGRNSRSASAAAPTLDPRLVADELTKLAGLRNAGVLSDDEFAAQKARLLG